MSTAAPPLRTAPTDPTSPAPARTAAAHPGTGGLAPSPAARTTTARTRASRAGTPRAHTPQGHTPRSHLLPARPVRARTRRPPTPGRRRRARAARRWAWRLRWLVVAACCGLAASATVQALRPAPEPLRSVVVPTHRITAGAQVQPDDVAVVAVPEDLAPPGALTDPDDAVGRVPAVTLEAGLPLSAGLVAGGEVAALAPEGTVVVPVRLDDATAALLRPGDHVDLVSTTYPDDTPLTTPGDATAAYLARRALVLPAGSRESATSGSGGLLSGGAGSATATVTLVAVTPAEAPALSAASGTGTLAAVLVP